MKNKINKLFIGLFLSCMTLGCSVKGAFAMDKSTYRVDFFNNYLREEFTLSNGFTGKGNNLLYQTVEVEKGSLVTKPTDPTRKNYDFSGWFKEEKCLNEWDFSSDIVNKNTRLFAKWSYSSKEEEGEPEYLPPSTILDDGSEFDYILDSIMHFKVEENKIKISTSALMRLEANKDNILPLMEYKVKQDKSFSATYSNNLITIKCDEVEDTIQVIDDSKNLVVETIDYETKAKKYEENALNEDSYHVMLAGSSSIEFWTTSEEDLDPIVSYNHGIGGTTIEDWDKCLNKRLVYPYKPKMVVYYVGINNVINSKQKADTIWGHLKNFFDHTHEAMPDTKVQYIMMNLIPGYPSYYDVINDVNNNVLLYQKEHASWLTLINPGMALLKSVNGADGVLKVDEKVNVTSNIELFAEWEDITEPYEEPSNFIVSFDGNGGTGSMDPVTVNKGEYTLPKSDFKAPEGYEFVGWRVNNQGTAFAKDSIIDVASDITLVAVWKGEEEEEAVETYQVSFILNGGTGSMKTVEEVRGNYILPGSMFKAPEGKRFVGWRVYGEPNAAYFRIDGLHLSNYGYVIWGEIIKDSIIKGLNE